MREERALEIDRERKTDKAEGKHDLHFKIITIITKLLESNWKSFSIIRNHNVQSKKSSGIIMAP